MPDLECRQMAGLWHATCFIAGRYAHRALGANTQFARFTRFNWLLWSQRSVDMAATDLLKPWQVLLGLLGLIYGAFLVVQLSDTWLWFGVDALIVARSPARG